MAKRNNQKPQVIDGFSSLQAVKRTGKGTEEAKFRESSSRLPDRKPDTPPEKDPLAAKRIGSTVMPARHNLTCYECGFEFVLTGRLEDTYCAKCRKSLKAGHHTISGEWTVDVKTLGTIDVKPSARADGVTLVCGNLVIAGDVSTCNITVCRTATFCAGAIFDLDRIQFCDVEIGENYTLSLDHKLACRHVNVKGRLQADATLSGRMSVACGGAFEGKLSAIGLTIEDGASLCADLNLRAPEKNHPDPITK
ncbi:MAG: cytoskeletal protein CcmA (bactofilin family) [Kiritimatiellia bacterium]|jgi:cytoskeletal protein CcmA (bactofilin family)